MDDTKRLENTAKVQIACHVSKLHLYFFCHALSSILKMYHSSSALKKN